MSSVTSLFNKLTENKNDKEHETALINRRRVMCRGGTKAEKQKYEEEEKQKNIHWSTTKTFYITRIKILTT
ncbi:unnamed protein product, partial [Rotaria sp. Silwood2]